MPETGGSPAMAGSPASVAGGQEMHRFTLTWRSCRLPSLTIGRGDQVPCLVVMTVALPYDDGAACRQPSVH